MFAIFGLGPAEVLVLLVLGLVVIGPVLVVVILVPLLARRRDPAPGLTPLERIRRELPGLTREERQELLRLLDEPGAD